MPSIALSTWLIRYWDFDTNWSFVDKISSTAWTINWATFTSSWKIDWWYIGDWVNDNIDTAVVIPSKTEGTFNIWVKDTSSSDTATRTIIADSWGGYFIIRSNYVLTNDGKFRFNFYSWSWKTVVETTAHNKNQWYMLTCTWDSSNIEMFVDTVSQWTAVAGALTNNANNLDFFTNAGGTFGDLVLDESWLWNKKLTSWEMSDLYAAWAGLPYN